MRRHGLAVCITALLMCPFVVLFSCRGLQLGLVFQSGALFDSLTVGENVGFLLYEHSDLPPHRIKVDTSGSKVAVYAKSIKRVTIAASPRRTVNVNLPCTRDQTWTESKSQKFMLALTYGDLESSSWCQQV